MRNGNLRDFIEGLHYGNEMLFEYGGKKYFVQGWTEKGKCYMFLDVLHGEHPGYIWKYEAQTMSECADAFLSEKLWNGENFYEIERNVNWTDW